MIQAVRDKLTGALPGVRIGVVVANDKAAEAARGLGIDPLIVWDAGFLRASRAILKFAPDVAVVIGADCMDGYYSPEVSARLIATADLIASRGCPVTFTGFSFNDKPHPFVVRAFDRLSGKVAVNLRDPVSFERFQRASRHPAQLVADAAFMLIPDASTSGVRAIASWVEAQRAAGHRVVGFNVHPTLFKGANAADVARLVESAIAALQRVLAETDIRLLLLAHDYRERDGDDRCLGGIFRGLQAGHSSRIHYPAGPFSAAELKGIASLVDGVVTGRMHLGVASLGAGVPVASITYQGKFKGLMQHFSYPDDMQISGDEAKQPDLLYGLVMRFVAALPELQAIARKALPGVKERSLDNLRPLLPSAPQA